MLFAHERPLCARGGRSTKVPNAVSPESIAACLPVLRKLRRLCRMRRFRMVVVQVRSQMVSNYDIPGYGCLETIFLHVAR